jgi:hypothetical protein
VKEYNKIMSFPALKASLKELPIISFHTAKLTAKPAHFQRQQ